MTVIHAWFVPFLLALIVAFGIMLGVWAATFSAPPEIERYEKTWCKEPSGELEACAIEVTP